MAKSGLLEEVVHACAEDFDDLASELEETMRDCAPKGTRMFAQKHPSSPWNSYKPGALKDSITKEKVSNTEYLVGVDADELKSDSRNPTHIDYSPIVVKGVSHPVKMTKRTGVFMWIDEQGKKNYAKSVTLPTRDGNDFVAEAVKKFNSK